jgi:hypothetical protein
MSMTKSNLLVVAVMMFFCSLADASEDQFILKELIDYPYVAAKERATSLSQPTIKKVSSSYIKLITIKY